MGTSPTTNPIKWSSGVLGNDGKIYAAPAAAVANWGYLIIDPATNTATVTALFGLSTVSTSTFGTGISTAGVIYTIPRSETTIHMLKPEIAEVELNQFLTIEISSVRDGYTSWQTYSHTVERV
jgi:hypothetical protein